MSIHLIETVQQNLGYSPLKKIDPNTQEVVTEKTSTVAHRFGQAAIPSILTAFYKYIQLDEGAESFLTDKYKNQWVNEIFGENNEAAIASIIAYKQDLNEDAVLKLNDIADEVVSVVLQQLAPVADFKSLRMFFRDQRNNILLYLPAELNMGELLNDETLDDKTNKMEGPISSLVRSIGSAFSTPVTQEEDLKK